jgi:hypothetical protein
LGPCKSLHLFFDIRDLEYNFQNMEDGE